MSYIVQTHQLTKRYKQFTAVDNVSLNIKQGEIYGFLGQNGAGKTTTIRMMMGLIRPSSGDVRLFGDAVKPGAHRHLERIGSIIEFPGAYPNLTAAHSGRAD